MLGNNKYFMFIALIIPLLSCCQSNSCRSDLQYFYIRNSNYEYNCGKEYLKIEKSEDLDFICAEFDNMQKVYPITTNYNSGYLEIIVNPTNNLFLKEKITLIFTIEKGYIFRMQDGSNYKNDELASYLIKKLGINNVYSNHPCKQQ